MNTVKMLYKCGAYWMVFLLLSGVSCGNPKSGQLSSTASADASEKETEDVLASIPAKNLLIFWNDFSFKRQTLAANRDHAEQKLVDFISGFSAVQDTVVQVALWDMLKKASADPDVLIYFLEKYKHYLYDPNSPMRNEDHYGKVLSYLVKADHVSADDKEKYSALLELVGKNQVGTKATDFSFIKADGQQQSLYAGTKPYKMLVFYDPTCINCAAILEDLAKTPAVHNCIENDFLDIVAVNLHPDKDSWERYQKRIPGNWISGWDKEGTVIHEGLYNITAYPAIFLLDKDNEVLLKDAPLDATLRYLVELVYKG